MNPEIQSAFLGAIIFINGVVVFYLVQFLKYTDLRLKDIEDKLRMK